MFRPKKTVSQGVLCTPDTNIHTHIQHTYTCNGSKTTNNEYMTLSQDTVLEQRKK